jgi:uncharacterized protein YcaQ
VIPIPRTGSVVSRGEARALSLAVQGFDRPRPVHAASQADVRAAVREVGLLQLDSVNVFCRSHYMPVFSRLGPYDRVIMDRMAAHTADDVERELIEYWAHEASLLTPELYPLLRWRMDRVDLEAWKFVVRLAREQPQLVEETLALVAAQGPIRASQTGQHRPARQAGQMWNWHDGKNALEYLFYAGRVATARRINFERLYDLPERVLPPEVLAAAPVDEAEAQRGLILFAARALGVAAESDLGDYFRLTRADSKQRVAELVEAGELETVSVEGWTTPAYTLRAVTAAAQNGADRLHAVKCRDEFLVVGAKLGPRAAGVDGDLPYRPGDNLDGVAHRCFFRPELGSGSASPNELALTSLDHAILATEPPH